MAIARSRVTSQGQISIPSGVRKKLGIGPGSILEWAEEGTNILIRRAGRFSCGDIHQAVFGPRKPIPRTLEELKQGIRTYVQKRHARS
jgi:antitoxin PrlF